MLRKIFFTFSSKLFISVINFLVILLTARYLGAEGRGIISLLILGITINLLISNIFGGASISFLTSRTDIYRLVAPAYCWAILSSLVITFILIAIGLIPEIYGRHLFYLSLLQAFYNIHLNILIGKSKIKAHNIVNTVQVAVLFLFLLLLIFFFGNKTVESYLYSLYGSIIFSLLISLYFLKEEIKYFPFKEWLGLWKAIFKNGYIIQIASIAQLLNYRLGYYLLDHYAANGPEGKKMVGIYSTAIAIAEAIWLVGRSMGLIQYSQIVKGTDDLHARKLTVKYGKISFLLTLFLVIPLIFLPEVFYKFLFGPEFFMIPQILLFLIPGILSFGLALMYSNYFAGLGLNKINMFGSLIGLVITATLTIIFIPKMGMKGAALASSCSYLSTSAFLIISFVRRTGLTYKEIFPGFTDLAALFKNTITRTTKSDN